MKSSIIALLAFAALAVAKPGGSPICDVAAAKDAFAASPMAPNQKNLAQESVFTFTADKASYAPNEPITITVSGVDFNGFLFYAAPTNDASRRVGKWTAEDGKTHAAASCQNVEDASSSLTQSAGQTFASGSTFTFTAPASDLGELTINAIIVVNDPAGGYQWGVYPGALKIAGSGSNAVITPTPTVLYSEETICPPQVTATVVRKCKVKDNFLTTVIKTETSVQVITETKTSTFTTTTYVGTTDTVTVTVPGVCTTSGAVLGEEETATSTEYMTTTAPYNHDYGYGATTTAAYNDDYGYGAKTTQAYGYGHGKY